MPELNAQAIEVRQLIERAAEGLQHGRRDWRQPLAEAARITATIEDPVSRGDAEVRVANIDHIVALHAGRTAEAIGHLERAIAVVRRLRDAAPAEEHRRLNDHEWGLHLNLCQAFQTTDLDRASAEADEALALAEISLEPAQHRVMTMVSVAAIAALREDWATALRLADDVVEQCRRDYPAGLGTALLGLAQLQTQTGALDEATRNADRAEPLLDEVGQTASLHRLRALIATQRQDLDSASAHFAAYADHAERHSDLLEDHHRSEAAKGRAFMAHATGDVRAARRLYAEEVTRARASGDPLQLVGALTQASGATQDVALSRLPLRRRSVHLEALAQVDEARDVAATIGRRHLAAALDMQWAKYVAQWHTRVTRASAPVLVGALERALGATVFLHHSTFTVGTASARRALASRFAAEAFDVSFDIAFRLGMRGLVAELIELRCATGQFVVDTDAAPTNSPQIDALGVLDEVDHPDQSPLSGSAETGGDESAPGLAMDLGSSARGGGAAELLLDPPPPLEFHPGRVALTEAFTIAAERYGLAADTRTPIACW